MKFVLHIQLKIEPDAEIAYSAETDKTRVLKSLTRYVFFRLK